WVMFCAGPKSSKRGDVSAIPYKSKKSRPKSGPAGCPHLAFNLACFRTKREHAASAPTPFVRTKPPETDDERDARRPALPHRPLCLRPGDDGRVLLAHLRAGGHRPRPFRA